MPRDELFEALFECWIGKPYTPLAASSITGTERGRINRAVKELRDVAATPDDVRVRWAAARAKWPTLTLTPQALVGHWSTLESSLRPVTVLSSWKAKKAASS